MAINLFKRSTWLTYLLVLTTLLSCFYSVYLTLGPLSYDALPSTVLLSRVTDQKLQFSSRQQQLGTFDASAFPSLVSGPKPLQVQGEAGDKGSHQSRRQLQTELSIYSIPNLFLKWQSIWVYDNLCYNGSHMLTLGESLICREADAFVVGGAVEPARCGSSLYHQRRKLRPEIKIPEAERPSDWLESRKAVEWRRGSSSVIYLDNTVENVAHFIGKVNMLLAMNNASVPALTERVDRFMFYQHEAGRQMWVQSDANTEAFHPTYLAMLLSRVLVQLGGKEVEPGDLLGTPVLQGGKVEIEAPFDAASEDKPLCFERAILPGFLKRSFWPGSLPVADMVREHLRHMLSPPPVAFEPRTSGPPLLLYVVRNFGLRVFLPETETRFRELLDKHGMETKIRDFSKMTFKEQFWSVQLADITISLHGANLVNPSMFSRRNSVLIEIVPFHIIHRMYESQAVDSGLIYMSHQCEQGTPQQGDHLFDSYTYQACIDTPACKRHFIKQRRVELSPGDLNQVERLLTLARKLIEVLNLKNLRDANDGRLSMLVESLLDQTTVCLPYAQRDNLCRRTWIAWNDGQGSRICYLHEVCGEFPVQKPPVDEVTEVLNSA